MKVRFKPTLMFAICIALLGAMMSPGAVFGQVENYYWDNGGGTSNRLDVAANYYNQTTSTNDVMLPDPPDSPYAPIAATMVDCIYDNRLYISPNAPGWTTTSLGTGATYGALLEDGMDIDFGCSWDSRYWDYGTLSAGMFGYSYISCEGGSATVDSMTITGGHLEADQMCLAWHFDGKVTMSGGTIDLYSALKIGASVTTIPGVVDEGIFNFSGGTINACTLNLGARYAAAVGTFTQTGGTINLQIREKPDLDGPGGDVDYEEPYIRYAYGEASAGYLNLHGGTFNIAQAWNIYREDVPGVDCWVPCLQMHLEPRNFNSEGVPSLEYGTSEIDITEGVMYMERGAGPTGDIVELVLNHVDASEIGAYGYKKGVDSEYGELVSVIVEYDPTLERTTLQASLVGDVDADGDVDNYDLAVMMTNHGMTEGATWSMGDMNYDGAVNDTDVAKLCANWLKTRADITYNSVPEPSVLAMFLGLAMAAFAIRRKQQN